VIEMGLVLGVLMATTVAVSILLSSLAKMSMKERLLQTAAMGAAALTFFGLVALLQSSVH